MKKALDKLSSGLLRFSSVVFFLVAVVMVVNILLRAILNTPIGGTIEIVQYGMLICIVLALSRTGFEGRHIRVTFFWTASGESQGDIPVCRNADFHRGVWLARPLLHRFPSGCDEERAGDGCL
jgi:hypothetical protein